MGQMSEPTQTQTQVREGGESVPPERTLEEIRSITESIRKEIESLRQAVESLKTEKSKKYAEVLEELVYGWGNVFDCLDKRCSAKVSEGYRSEWFYIRLDGPETIRTEVTKDVTIGQAFDLLREEIRKNYSKLLTTTTKTIMEVLREGILDEVREVMREVESVKRKLDNLETAVREVEESLEEEEEVEEDG
ncbi:MAG: hypothetical protein QXT73_07395 [Candidatus Methanomethylicaceae archaeon]